MNRFAADPAVRVARASEQQAEIIVDLGGGCDGRTRIRADGPLFDGDRRGETFDVVDVGLGELFEELPGVGAECLDVFTLALGVNRIKGQRTLARAAQACDDDELIARDID